MPRLGLSQELCLLCFVALAKFLQMDLQELRKKLGYDSQAEFGRAIKRSMQAVQGYERANRVPPEIAEKIVQMARAKGLEREARDLLGGSTKPVGQFDRIERKLDKVLSIVESGSYSTRFSGLPEGEEAAKLFRSIEKLIDIRGSDAVEVLGGIVRDLLLQAGASAEGEDDPRPGERKG